MADHSKFVIVAENEFHNGCEVAILNTFWKIEEYHTHSQKYLQSVICKNVVSQWSICHAEVLFIRNNAVDAKIYKEIVVGQALSPGTKATSIIIRILELKEKFLMQLEDRWTADVTFIVNSLKCAADRHSLAAVSPVFKKMLLGESAEAKQSDIVFKGTKSAIVFNDFLLAISPFRVQPNPRNVVDLLKLAHQYDIPFLMRNCEEHLKHCHEIPVVARLILAGRYGLECLKLHLGPRMSNDELKKMWNEHREMIRDIGGELLFGFAINRL